MRPDDLIEFSRRHYLEPGSVQSWGSDQLVNSGLTPLEQQLLDKITIRKGRLLLLGVGGGREAIPLAKMGFQVTGVDYIPGMIEQAEKNAKKNGVELSGLLQDISDLLLPENAFDIVWLSAAMYSCVPTRKKRIAMLNKIYKSLRPGSYFALGFFWHPQAQASSRSVWLKRLVAGLTLGNIHYEKGDMLRFNREFIHAFATREEIEREMIQGGFELVDIQASAENKFAGAVARKPRLTLSK